MAGSLGSRRIGRQRARLLAEEFTNSIAEVRITVRPVAEEEFSHHAVAVDEGRVGQTTETRCSGEGSSADYGLELKPVVFIKPLKGLARLVLMQYTEHYQSIVTELVLER